ncbi:expressed unknown protein [Seminavis robusta]|uniref:Uncharacterized protein n=1 Tax=Seminavis robusta TaxID=568900 RepID=A0A9N8DC88_9STRA|nr:expressed unknown protein [Seminavis robusta]|eukprot:Sro82_g043680.1 n/a (95) ;mRNA; f:9936-10220
MSKAPQYPSGVNQNERRNSRNNAREEQRPPVGQGGPQTENEQEALRTLLSLPLAQVGRRIDTLPISQNPISYQQIRSIIHDVLAIVDDDDDIFL